MRTFPMLVAAALVAGCGATPPVVQDQAGACTVDVIQASAPEGTTITGAALVPASGDLPAHCQVDGRAVSSGNEVTFRVALPEAWNGKFWFSGVGGLAGRIPALEEGLARGYASAGTDTGHTADDPDWGANRAQEIDYGYRGAHVATVATRALATAFYGQAPAYSYFQGCSNGGRMALMEAQRYPEDFDGIIAGHPATGTPMQVGRAIFSQHLLASAENYLTPDKVELLSRATVAACDAADGLVDGLVSAPDACTFDPAILACAGGDGPDCLTPGQVESATRIYGGLTLPDGERYTAGFPVGHEGGDTGWQAWITGRTPATELPDGTLDFVDARPAGFNFAAENMRFLALEDDDPSLSWRTLRFPDDLPRLRAMSDILSPLDADLTPFRERGGGC